MCSHIQNISIYTHTYSIVYVYIYIYNTTATVLCISFMALSYIYRKLNLYHMFSGIHDHNIGNNNNNNKDSIL